MSLRCKVLLPIVSLALLFAFVALSWWPDSSAGQSLLRWVIVAGCALLVGSVWLTFELLVLHPLGRLSAKLDGDRLVNKAHGDEMSDVDLGVSGLQQALSRKEAELNTALEARKQLEISLGEYEERYALAIRGTNDGLWEWDLATGRMYLSPRWKGMLGFKEGEIKDHIEAWKNQIHLGDRPCVDTLLSAHLQGESDQFKSQHRVMHRDASYRWVLSTATAVRHASGKPYRVIGLDSDISQYKRIEEVLMHLVEGTAGTTGDEFFRSIVKHFAAVLGVRQAMIAECVNHPTTRVRPLATWDNGQFIEDPEYDLAGTPCEEVVVQDKLYFIPKGAGARYECSAQQHFDSYLGMPIHDSSDRVVGHLAFQDEGAMTEDVMISSVYRIFVSRAAAELERRNTQKLVLGLAQALSDVRGEECFRVLAKSFAAVVEMKEAFITQCMEQPPRRLRMLAWWRGDRFVDPIEYDVEGSACAETVQQCRACVYPSGVGDYFSYAKEYGWEAYVGLPCVDSAGRVIGHIAAAHDKALQRSLPDEAIMKLFSERAGAELSRTRLQWTLLRAIDGLSNLRGEECFRAMVRELCQILGVREAFVCECLDHPAHNVRMVARWNKGDFANCVDFDLAGTTCETVIDNAAPLYWPKDLGERWPLETTYDRDSYLGIPCFDSEKRVIGHIACADGKPMPEQEPEWAILKLFGERAAIELERRRLTDAKHPAAADATPSEAKRDPALSPPS
jgi:PAS domain S-box-containing protein